jgi:hypothetical protein
MTQEQLAAMLEDQGLGSFLDEEVHGVKSNEATDINNAGPTSQISCLLAAGYDLDTIWHKVMGDPEPVTKPDPVEQIQPKGIKQKIIDVARSKYQSEGDVDIDDNTKFSIANPPDDGLYVQAWVWVYLSELPGVGGDDLEELLVEEAVHG